jgi:hypothetical protein
MYACLANGLSIHPSVNLVRNIGTAEGATHMRHDTRFANRALGALERELRHPAWVVRDRQADMHTFDDRFVGAVLKRQRTLRHQVGRPFRWAGRAFRRVIPH